MHALMPERFHARQEHGLLLSSAIRDITGRKRVEADAEAVARVLGTPQ
jgi:hypothetical protein